MLFRGGNEGVPLHSPPFKIAMSQSNGLRMKDAVKLHASDVSQSSGVFAIELHYKFWCGDFGGRLPEIVFVAISFLLNEILESSPVPMTVEYLLYFLLHYSVDNYGWWVVFCFLSVTVVPWTSSHILYSLPLHQKSDVSKATC